MQITPELLGRLDPAALGLVVLAFLFLSAGVQIVRLVREIMHDRQREKHADNHRRVGECLYPADAAMRQAELEEAISRQSNLVERLLTGVDNQRANIDKLLDASQRNTEKVIEALAEVRASRWTR